MNRKIEAACYGGKSKAFFKEQNKVIHQYNVKMLDRLLLVMTSIMAAYYLISRFSELFTKYSVVYLVCFFALLSMFFTFRWKVNKSISLTKVYIILASCILFAFVCILGTVFEPNTRATLFIVYVLALPMLFVVPTHYMYGFLGLETFIFSIIAFTVKPLQYAKMDMAHGITCLVVGIFISRHILESRLALYAVNEELDTQNLQLENLTQNIPGGVFQCKNDEKLTLKSTSSGFLEMFGYSKEEIKQLYHNSFLEMIYEEDREYILEQVKKCLKAGEDIEVEHRVKCKNRKAIWILGRGRLLPDGNGGEGFYGMLIEITDRKQAQEELRLRLEQHQIIMDQATDILFEWDIRRDTLNFSANWRKKFGYDAISDKISGRIPLSDNIHTEDMPAFVKIMQDTAAGKPYSEAEFRIRDSKNHYRWCRIRATAQFNSEGRAVKAVGVILDIHAEKKEIQNLLKMAQRDPLTGIYNKAATNSLVTSRMEDFDFTVMQALLIIDIDHFKTVNDTYGHMAGDLILTSVARELKGHTRSTDVVGRIGGDEFLVYLTEVENKDFAILKAKELHAALRVITPQPGAEPITCSIGVAVCGHGTIDYVDLYQHADIALYQCKNEGRDGIKLYVEP